MRFSSNLLGDSQNLQEGLATKDSVANPSPRTGDSVANPSPRTGDSVANYSWRFYDSLRTRRTANQKSTEIGEPQAQLPKILRDS
jgi:hypothetical protein